MSKKTGNRGVQVETKYRRKVTVAPVFGTLQERLTPSALLPDIVSRVRKLVHLNS